MKRDPWSLYCEAFRESFPGAGVKVELSPVALDAFYRKVMETECVPPEGVTIPLELASKILAQHEMAADALQDSHGDVHREIAASLQSHMNVEKPNG